MNGKNLEALGALVMVAAAMGVVCFMAAVRGSEQALGALIGVVAAGVGFYLRGKVDAR